MRLSRLILALLLATISFSSVQAEECVILLHGLAKSSASMEKMAKELKEAGFAVVNFGYPLTEGPIEALSNPVIKDALSLCPDGNRAHFVTHSLGGMKDHITVPVSHPFLMQDREVVRQTIHFLKYGQFHELEDAR